MLPLFLKPYDVKITDLIRIGPKSDGGYVIHKDSIHLTKKIITCGLNDMGFKKVSHIDGGFGAIKQSKFRII